MRVLFITTASPEKGLGHLKRSEYLAHFLLQRGADVFFSDEIKNSPDIVIIDRREHPENSFLVEDAIKKGIPSIVWGDTENRNATATIFWELPDSVKTANLYGPEAVIVRPPEFKPEKWKGRVENVLVSMGGSDPFCLTDRAVKTLNEIEQVKRVVVVKGRFFKCKSIKSKKTHYTNEVKSLYPLINESDLVITSYGLTLFETFTIKRPVAVMFHTSYHRKMFEKMKLEAYSLPLGNKKTPIGKLKRKLEEFITSPDKLQNQIKHQEKLHFTNQESLINLIENLAKTKDYPCPLCKSEKRKAIKRTPRETLFRCEKCKSIYRVRWEQKEKNSDAYQFTVEAQKRYGKTYLEMEDEIRRISRKRIEVIKELTDGKKILDIGSATGIFVEEASRKGFRATGVESSKWAVERAMEKGINLINIDFLSLETPEKYDAITAWFVMEHCEPEKFIKKCLNLLNHNGVIALALPRGDGATARVKPHFYAEILTEDHLFEPSLKGIKDFLKKHGFNVQKVIHSGFHPERTLGKRAEKLASAIVPIMKFLKMGDTFEIYAKKL